MPGKRKSWDYVAREHSVKLRDQHATPRVAAHLWATASSADLRFRFYVMFCLCVWGCAIVGLWDCGVVSFWVCGLSNWFCRFVFVCVCVCVYVCVLRVFARWCVIVCR